MRFIRQDTFTIALDARDLARDREHASTRYLTQLYKHVLELKPYWQVIGYHRSTPPDELVNLPGYSPRLMNIPGDQFNSWQQVRLPITALLSGVDLLHCPAQNCPRWVPRPTIITVNDLQADRSRQTLAQACARAAAITCTSNYIAHQIQSAFTISPHVIHVCPWSGNIEQKPITEPLVRQVMDKFRVTKPYVLHFGSDMNMSSTCRMLESWAMLPRQLRKKWQLLIVDLDGTDQRGLLSLAGRLGTDKSVILHGHISEDELPVLFGCGWILACPSMSESQTPHILNAFNTGTAVLTSNHNGLAETAGDAAVKAEANCTASIYKALLRLMKESDFRNELVERGKQRVKEYTWRNSARQFIDCVESVRSVGQRRLAA